MDFTRPVLSRCRQEVEPSSRRSRGTSLITTIRAGTTDDCRANKPCMAQTKAQEGRRSTTNRAADRPDVGTRARDGRRGDDDRRHRPARRRPARRAIVETAAIAQTATPLVAGQQRPQAAHRLHGSRRAEGAGCEHAGLEQDRGDARRGTAKGLPVLNDRQSHMRNLN